MWMGKVAMHSAVEFQSFPHTALLGKHASIVFYQEKGEIFHPRNL